MRSALRPVNLWPKVSRRIRERMHSRSEEEANFFFGENKPALTRADLTTTRRPCSGVGCETVPRSMRNAWNGSSEPPGLRQPEKGRLYLFRQRTLRHERQLRAKLAAGLLKGVQFPVRVRWFPSTSDAPETRRDFGAYHRARPCPGDSDAPARLPSPTHSARSHR